MSAVVTMKAFGLRAGHHEIRVPGKPDWLPLENVERRTDGTGAITEIILHAGGRTFVTQAATPWPARDIEPGDDAA